MFRDAIDILLENRPRHTPVLLATSLGRIEEKLKYTTLAEVNILEVNMLTVVIIGSSQSKLVSLGEGKRMYTPRGYAQKIDGDLTGD